MYNVFFSIFFIPLKEDDDLQTRTYQDLGIDSTKRPFNTHLWWEHSTYGIIMVDSTNQTVLLQSTKARLLVDGSDWTTIDLSDNTNSYKIQAGSLEGNDLWLVMCDNDGTADDFEVCFIELDDSNDCNPIGVSAGADINTVYAHDIFKLGSNILVMESEERTAQTHIVVWDVDTAPNITEVHNRNYVAQHIFSLSFGVVVGTGFYFSLDSNLSTNFSLFKYDSAGGIGAALAAISGFNLPSNGSQKGLSYDGIDTIFYIANKIADGLNYLYAYSVTDDINVDLGVYNIALMLDRNNEGVFPNELEKGFGISNEITYEIKARRGGIIQLQDLSALLTTNIIAITDNFLMVDDIGGGKYPLYEFQDVTKKITETSYDDSIIGKLKKGFFTAHPDVHSNWNIGDSIKWYDDNDVLEFWGIIIDKNQQAGGLYRFPIDSFTNEVYRTTYDKAYTGDDLDTKQKDIIDNACNFCYRSSSIVGTATNFDYDYKRAIAYLFYLGRFLERQVPYIEPDGKIWTKAHDGLVASGKSWDINDNSQNVFLIDIPDIIERQTGYFNGNTGITRAVVRYKDNNTTTKPTIPASGKTAEELLVGVKPLNEFRDPKIEASTEADQTATNLHNIFSTLTKFLAMRVEGQGFIQCGKTIEIENTGQVTIAKDNFVLLEFTRDPKNDIYREMIVSDNIVFTREFKTFNDTSPKQLHTAVVQSFENQEHLTNFRLDELNNPAGDTEFNFANKHLHFKWVAPAAGAHQGAFELEASGAFQNDLVHIHQHTGNPGATDLVHIEAEDGDVKCLVIEHDVSGGIGLQVGDDTTTFTWSIEGTRKVTDQHSRELGWVVYTVDDGYTAGAANVYINGAVIIFGTTSKTNAAELHVSFHLDSGYVDGTNIRLRLWVRVSGGGNPETIDYEIQHYRVANGAAINLEETLDSTFVEDFSGNKVHNKEVILDGTNHVSGDIVRADIRMEEDGNTHNIFLYGVYAFVTVDERD